MNYLKHKHKQATHIHLPLYLTAAAIAVLIKWFCSINDCDAYLWILTPTSRWVSILCGVSFTYIPHTGYLNHFHQFLIAPACSGIRFMLLTFLMLLFSFLHPGSELAQKNSVKKSCLWFGFSILFSYLATVFVNGVRISASIYLPILLESKGALAKLSGGWLTPERLHTIIGTVTYFSSLCILYPIATFICRRIFLRAEKKEHFTHAPFSSFIPAFWYLLTVLVIPLLGRIYHREWEGFYQYAAIVLGICLVVMTPSFLLHLFSKKKTSQLSCKRRCARFVKCSASFHSSTQSKSSGTYTVP